MTPETQATLEQMFEYARARAEWHPSLSVTDPGWNVDDLAECVEDVARWGRRALALRDVLTPHTCGTCRHCIPSENRMRNVCDNIDAVGCNAYRVDPNDGCIKGWQAREGEGGTR